MLEIKPIGTLSAMRSCHFCGAKIPSDMIIGNASVCPLCTRPLKVCLNCRFYDKNAYHECKEDIDEPVIYKDLANFCDFFVMREGDAHSDAKTQEEARSKFLSLFDES